MKISLVLLGVLIVSGCASISPKARTQHLHTGLQDHEVLVLEAVLHWYHNYRNPKFTYRFDESDSFFSSVVKDRLSAQIPEFREKEDGAFCYVSIPKIEFPEAAFGYAEVIIGDPFYAERYVEVFEKRSGGWQIINSITIASGTLDVLMAEFNWSAFYRDLLQERSSQLPDPTVASGRGSS